MLWILIIVLAAIFAGTWLAIFIHACETADRDWTELADDFEDATR